MTTMNLFDMTDTWNSAGTTFAAIRMNVTDTASAAGSLLLDLQVGGVTKASITKQGRIVAGASYQYANPQFYDSTEGTTTGYGIRANSTTMYVAGTANLDVGDVTNGIRIRDELWLGWAPGHALSNPADTRLYRDAADTLALRRGTNAQTFRVYNTFTDASNYERVVLGWSGNNFRITTEHSGTGSGRKLQFGIAGSAQWEIDGNLLAVADNTRDIGASGANRPRNVFVAGYVAPSNLRIEDNAGANGVRLYRAGTGILTLYNTAETDFNRLQFGGTTSAFPALKRNGTAINVRLADDSADAPFTSGRATIQGLTIGLGGQTAVATNTAVGREALHSASLTGGNNSAMGIYALLSNTTGSSNSALGLNALFSNTTGNNNSAVGAYALQNNTTGGTNSAMGVYALHSNTTGANNSAMGIYALYANTTGGDNSAMGAYALQNNTTGSNNSAVGREALYSNTTGGSNNAMGRGALFNNTTGSDNSAVGVFALQNNTTGGNNSAVGREALLSNTTGGSNSAMGRNALFSNTTGGNNSAVGYAAGDVITTGARNTIVGANSDPSANNGNDQTVIGEGLTGKGDDTFFCGGTNGAYNEKNVTTWETTSDARLKKNIVSNGVGLEVISQIDVRNFEYRTPEEITDLPASAAINQPGVQLGVIAQELQAVLPECVTENSTGVLSVNTDPLVWYLINAVQQLSAEVKALKGE